MIRLKRHQVALEPIYDSDYYNATSRLIKIPSTAKERCDQGIIKYLGSDCDPAFRVGNTVIFSGYTGTTVAIDDEILILMNYEFIKAIISPSIPIPGVYFKGKDRDQETADSIRFALENVQMRRYSVAEAMEHISNAFKANNVLFEASYEKVFSLAALAYNDFISPYLDVKVNNTKEQRDPIDERDR